MKIFVLLCAVFLAACVSSPFPTKEVADKYPPTITDSLNAQLMASVRSGDLVFRRGRDLLSDFFSSLNKRDQRFSHCGIACVTDTGTFVYHIIATTTHPDGLILYETLPSFVDAKAHSAWGLVRYNGLNVAALLDRVQFFQNQQVRFDHHFDLSSNHQLYCTELVYKCLLGAGIDSAAIGSEQNVAHKVYIPVDALLENKFAATIGQIAY